MKFEIFFMKYSRKFKFYFNIFFNKYKFALISSQVIALKL